jgi:hypothetical protein
VVLQIRIQAVREFPIFGGIADEAGIELKDFLCLQRHYVLDFQVPSCSQPADSLSFVFSNLHTADNVLNL